MPKWLDDNTIEGELSNEEFIKQVMEQMTARVEKEEKEINRGNYGNDGLITVYEEEKSHAGLHYKLKALRYFAVTRLPYGHFELRDARMNKLGKHVVVETDREGLSYEVLNLLNLGDFLWHDTLHADQEDWSLKKQWEYAESLAVQDCELVANLEVQFDNKVAELRQELRSWIKAVSP